MAQKMTSPRSRLSTLRKESSEAEDAGLAKERKSSLVPISKSPFKKEEEENELSAEPTEIDEGELQEDELQVYVTEVPWSDLLLEIAMTTTFSSLTDGTPVLSASDVTSYLCFFALVWWIWASQVAYNVRFRTSDWLHRLFVFFQLLVFSALAAFTNNFDIFNGLAQDKNQSTVAQLQLASFLTKDDIAAENYRENRLPTLNARGLSVVMALSRLLLLVQYVIALIHAPREKVVITSRSRYFFMNFARIQPNLRSFYVHIGTLAFSLICYMAAYIVIGKNPSTVEQAVKLPLWYLPLFVEVAAHYYAMRLPGRVRYLPEAISARTSTVFIIILGGGLDKITNGFQYIVGNVSLGSRGVGLILSAALIFVTQFTLYFTMTESGKDLSNRRILTWFFFHYLYLSALIVTLQGVAALLQFGTIGDALELPVNVVRELSSKLNQTGPLVYLNVSDFSDLIHPLNKTGLALDSVIEFVNYGVELNVNSSNTEQYAPYNAVLQYGTVIIGVILQDFDAYPDEGSLLYSQMDAFIQNTPDNSSVINSTAFRNVVQEVFVTNALPSLWFYAAGGSTLVCLAFLSIIKQWPRDKYEWGQIGSRLSLGTVSILMSALDVHATASVITDDWIFTGSRIWMLAAHSWVLPPFAVMLVLEQLVEYVLLYLAGRSYTMPRMAGFFATTTPFSPYVNRGGVGGTRTSFRKSMTPSAYERPFDPYAPYEDSDSIGPLDRGMATFQRTVTKVRRPSYYYPPTRTYSESSDMAPLITAKT